MQLKTGPAGHGLNFCSTPTDPNARVPVPRFSSDIGDAWPVLTRLMQARGIVASLINHGNQGWQVCGGAVSVEAKTAPLAICL